MGAWSDGVPVKPMVRLDPDREATRLKLRPRSRTRG